MKNIFESTYKELDENGELYECDGGAGCAGGGISGGDMTTGTPLADGSGIASDAVLGPSGEFEKGKGFMGKGDFHVAFPVCPMLFRYGKDCCNGGGSNKKRKKGKKIVSVKNPYTKGMKTIIAEDGDGVIVYAGQAKEEFDKVVSDTQQVYTGVLNYNDRLKLAWMVREDGVLHMYKPINTGKYWTIYATSLTEDGMIQLDYKAGMYQDENTALNAVYKAAQQHKQALEEHLKKLNESNEEFQKIDDIEEFLNDSKLPWKKVWKFQRLNARKANGGERIKTVGSDGNIETERTAQAGDWIVSNVSNKNNEWIINGKTFDKKYEPTAKSGIYKPKGGEMLACPVSAKCETGVEFAPPNWGGDVIKIMPDGYFMKDPTNPSDIYAISKKDFDSTYSDKKPVNEQRFSPRDIMNWEAHGRDPRYAPSRKPDINVRAITSELKQKFYNQFEDVRLQDVGGTWKAEFTVEGINERIAGQQRVKTVIPRIDDIVRLLRLRGIETNQYDIAAVPAQKIFKRVVNEGFSAWTSPDTQWNTEKKCFAGFSGLDKDSAKMMSDLDLFEFNGDLNGIKSCLAVGEGSDRVYCVVIRHGINIPFYVSTGLGGKERVPSGKWYPFFGKGSDGWLNKGSDSDILAYYGSKLLKHIAQTLDNCFDMTLSKSWPKIAENCQYSFANCSRRKLEAVYNRDLNPVEYGDPSLKKNIDKFLAIIQSGETYYS